jgi:hypothetical protein
MNEGESPGGGRRWLAPASTPTDVPTVASGTSVLNLVKHLGSDGRWW